MTSNEFIDAARIRSWVVAEISTLFDVQPTDLDIHIPLIEYGMDSRQLVELGIRLEEKIGHTLPQVVWDNPSIDQIAHACASHAARLRGQGHP